MRRFSLTLLLFALCLVLASPAAADEREQAQFAIQKAGALIDKAAARSDEMKVPAGEIQKARIYLENAAAILKKHTSWRGKLDPDTLPEVLYWTEMAEIAASTGAARLDKVSHERENVKLEKAIPDIEARIKVFEDKNEEIRRLREQAGKPQGEVKNLSGEVSQLKTERAKLTGQVEALNTVVAGLRKDLAEKIRAGEELSVENRRLKEDLKAIETQKGADVVQMQGQVRALTRSAELQRSIESMNYLIRPSSRGPAIVIPRGDLLRTTTRGSSLTPQADRELQRIAEIAKANPGARLVVKVHGSGKPTKTEDRKSTDAMAQLLRTALQKAGVAESAIDASGAGTAEPLFPKGSGDENRRVEIQVIPATPSGPAR